jgi:hypothetical protein
MNGTNNCSAGILSLVYDGVNPSFTQANGLMTLSAATTFNVDNTGAQLAHGSYKLIAAGAGGLVAGSLPTVTVNGGGAASPNYLWLSGNELYLAVNNAPVAANINLGAQAGVLQTLPLIGAAKHAPTDADSDALTISAVTQGANGGVVTISGNSVTYSNNATGADSFTYTVSDSYGGSDTKTVTVNVTDQVTQQPATISLTGSDVNVTFWGVPGTNYTVQTAGVITGPWSDLTPQVTASTSQPIGQISYTYTNAPSGTNAFFRLKP